MYPRNPSGMGSGVGIVSVKLKSAKSGRSAELANSTILWRSGPHPHIFELALSGELLETAGCAGISSRSSTTSKQERLIQPRMITPGRSILHMRELSHAIRMCVKNYFVQLHERIWAALVRNCSNNPMSSSQLSGKKHFLSLSIYIES